MSVLSFPLEVRRDLSVSLEGVVWVALQLVSDFSCFTEEGLHEQWYIMRAVKYVESSKYGRLNKEEMMIHSRSICFVSCDSLRRMSLCVVTKFERICKPFKWANVELLELGSVVFIYFCYCSYF